MRRLACLLILASAVLTACGKPAVVAPTDRGVCYYVVKTGEGESDYRFDRIAGSVSALEYCAAELEKMRLGLSRLGVEPKGEIIGSYQGRFLYLTPYGIYTAQKWGGTRYILMVPYNGKLVVPGAVPH